MGRSIGDNAATFLIRERLPRNRKPTLAIPLDQFVKQIEDSGILAGDTLKDFIPPKATPKDATDLARELVRQKKLTKFQVEEVSKGKGKSLVLGNYVLMEKIGAGGMGQVFKARHRRMDRLVAVKLLPAAMTKDKAAIARFEREVKAAAKLRHPNIVAADDADQANGVHFLVMEMVEGSDLSALVKKNGPFSVEKAVNYILQTAKGLEFAHKKGVVHRDIKPANLLLDKEGTVKILDMGLARIEQADGPAQADLTNTGTIMGTVDYMAPEQALDTKTADARADIYSLGCSLYYLLTGNATYDGDTLMKKLMAHQNQPIPVLRTICPEVPEQLEAVFRKMVAKKIEGRYQTMTEVIAELERCGSTDEQTIPAQPPSSSFANTGLTNLLNDISLAEAKPVQRKKTARPSFGKKKKQLLLIGGGVLGAVILLAGIVINLKTKDGTLVITVNEPDAEVQILNEEGKVEITRKREKGPITITVVPGKHGLKVQKDGFELFTDEFEIKSGGDKSITAKLVPVKDKPAAVETIAGDKPWNTPDFQKWTKDVQAIPAEEQVKAVVKKLQELNPAFKGGIEARYEKGVVTRVHFENDNVTNIMPLRALVGLRELSCISFSQQGQSGFSDLSPLQDMKLSTLICYNTSVLDLSPLVGMPLEHLEIAYTKVFDLTPLKGMQLKHLGLHHSRVANLSPLRGMPLRSLVCYQTPVADLSPLVECKRLKHLNAGGTNVTAAGAALLHEALVNCQIIWGDKPTTLEPSSSGKPITDFNTPAFQQWMKDVAAMPAENQVGAVSKKLVEVNPGFDGKVMGWKSWNDVENNGPPKIENGVVTEFGVYTDDVRDLSPIRALTGMKRLSCMGSGPGTGLLLDLSPLRDMKLEHLYCAWCPQITDLSPLKGMPLAEFGCEYTNVNDLSPLKGMAVKELFLHGTPISDLSPLDGMDLTLIFFTPRNITKGIDVIRQMKSLQSIDITDGTNFSFLSASEFWKKYDAGEFGKPMIPTVNVPAFETWIKEVQAMPAKEQVEAVSKKLMELNPGFEGKVHPGIVNGVVHSFHFTTESITDISPVRAFPGVSILRCDGSQRGGRLSDLSPLKGMTLTYFTCYNNPVSDLSPFTGMATLRDLQCGYTGVKDLSPLNGMSLTNLSCYGTRVSSLSPLIGMKLLTLNISNTPISDFSPLREMPLTGLYCTGSRVSDLSPLAQCNDLKSLHVSKTKVTSAGVAALQMVLPNCKVDWDDPAKARTDINSPAFQQWVKDVAALPAEKQVDALSKKLMELNPGFDGKIDRSKIESGAVKELHFATDKVTDVSPVRALPELMALAFLDNEIGKGSLDDLSPLRGMHLTYFVCVGADVADINPLKGMLLEWLELSETKVADLAPLLGMPLTGIKLRGSTGVTSLLPLRDMHLDLLNIYGTQVSDISPLKGMPLKTLNVGGTKVSDLSLLKDMPLKNVTLDFKPERDTELLRSIKTLETINDKPVAEFWKEVEKQQKGK